MEFAPDYSKDSVLMRLICQDSAQRSCHLAALCAILERLLSARAAVTSRFFFAAIAHGKESAVHREECGCFFVPLSAETIAARAVLTRTMTPSAAALCSPSHRQFSDLSNIKEKPNEHDRSKTVRSQAIRSFSILFVAMGPSLPSAQVACSRYPPALLRFSLSNERALKFQNNDGKRISESVAVVGVARVDARHRRAVSF